jgi:hypothetical protein
MAGILRTVLLAAAVLGSSCREATDDKAGVSPALAAKAVEQAGTAGASGPAPAAALLGAARGGNGESAGKAGDQPWFTEITEQAKLSFNHDAGIDGTYRLPQIMGAGCAMLDYDSDGDTDLYLVNSGPMNDPLPNRLFRREADGTYTDVTEPSGVGDRGYGLGVACGDYDNDGDADVYAINYGADALYRNNGDGTFADVTAAAGITDDEWGVSAAFVDYDLDGWLDLYVADYVMAPEGRVCLDKRGQIDFCAPLTLLPLPDQLYRNNGDGTFSNVTAAAGIGTGLGRGLGVACDDFNGDGWIDIYVANDGDANFLWMNDRDGTFTESAMMLGAALSRLGEAQASMGVAVGDVDGDLDPDLFMTHFSGETNTMYLNLGSAGFEDVSAASGVAAVSRTFTGFGTGMADFDNDGALDLAVVNGRVRREPMTPGADPSFAFAVYAEHNHLLRGDGKGRFTDISDRAGMFTSRIEVGRGMALGDLDDDGGVDMLITNCHGPARLFRNSAPRGHWLIVRAIDPALRRDAYGAIVRVEVGGRAFVRTINPCLSYGSCHDVRAHFGLGDAAHVDSIEVRWPGGPVERFGGMAADQSVVLKRSEGRP